MGGGVSGPSAAADPSEAGPQAGEVRLQKALADAGVASRRACEELMLAGRVTVNGVVVTRLGTRVDPVRDVVRVDGGRIAIRTGLVYLALNKPRGVLSTMRDPRGRPTVADLLGDRSERLFHVGRLDADTEGLLLLTNDGDLAHRLMHPSFGVVKTYVARVRGSVPRALAARLRAGIEIDDRPVAVHRFRVVDTRAGSAIVELSLHEGRKHIVRRLLAGVGLPVERLARTAIGPVRLGDLPAGRSRPLTQSELAALLELTEQHSVGGR